MNFRKLSAFATVTLTLGLGVSVADAQGKIYWTEFGAIRRANLDGSNTEDLVTTGLTNTMGIALDVAGGKMYWADAGVRKIQRADLDGANVEDLVGEVGAYGIALDVTGGKMYWTTSNLAKIQRANLDGSGIEDLIGGVQAYAIALDVSGGKMYLAVGWAAGIDFAGIRRATLDGAVVEDLVFSPGRTPDSLALDVVAGKMYWTSASSDFREFPTIQRANLDGSEVVILVDEGPGVYGFPGIDVDPAAGKIYWTTASPGMIRRANLNGSGIEIVLDNPSAPPAAIALDNRQPSIPTLSESGVVATAALLLGIGAIIIRRGGGACNRRAASRRFWSGSMMTRQCHVFAIMALVSCFVTTSRAEPQPAPRTPLAKPATISKPPHESRLTLKFRDDLKVRAVASDLTSLVGADLGSVYVVKEQFALSFDPMIRLPQATLDYIETRAAQRSGVAQPDLAGMMVVYGPEHTIEAAAHALLALAEVEWVYFSALNYENPCDDILPPTTPNYFALRGPEPIRDYHAPDPGLDMACAWHYGARGQGIKIADCEGAYHRGHEDLCGINEPEGQEFAIGESKDHGTAVLGILVALDNAYGWTGLVPEAIAWFFTQHPGGEDATPQSRATAITDAIATVDPGDIVLLEMQTAGPYSPGWVEYAPAELEPGVWTATCTATHSGIIVIAAAGNYNYDLDSPSFAEYRSRVCDGVPSGDSGAIIVGDGTADKNHNRSGGCYGQRVNVQGWGQNVFTLGYGNHAFLGWDIRQTYTHTFSGTSSASALVAGAAAALQSLRVNHVPALDRLDSPQMRQLLIDTGIAQGETTNSTLIGPFPNIGKAILHMGIGAVDCNGNARPDDCDIASGKSIDCDENGVPDECEADTGACCRSSSQNDCVMTTTSACCDAANGLFWYGLTSKCETTDCSMVPLRQQSP